MTLRQSITANTLGTALAIVLVRLLWFAATGDVR